MTYRKTHLWISLVVGLFVWGAYFTHVIQTVRSHAAGNLALWFIGALVVMVIVEAVATGLIAWLFRRRTRRLDDGPTLQAALKASHVALMILVALVLLAAAALSISVLFGWSPTASPKTAVIAANALLAMVVIAELARAAFTLALAPRR